MGTRCSIRFYPMTILVLTPLPVEFEAVLPFLQDLQEPVIKDAAAYELGTFKGKHHNYKMVVREPGMRNVDMALATEKAIQHFQPDIVLLVGIAGGVKDVQIGDVLVPKKVYGYESGKEDADGFKARPAVESFSGELLARAQIISRRPNWKQRTPDGAVDARVFLGPIAAGEKVVAGTANPTYERIKLHYNDTLGLEMEAIGFATALQGHRSLHGMAIRGISDLCEGKSETDKHNWQPVAAARAAAFAFEMLYELDAAGFISEKKGADTVVPTPPNNAVKDTLIKQLRILIAAGRIKDAIPQLLEYAEKSDPDTHVMVLQLSGDWGAFARKERMGLMSNDEANIERSRITARMLGILGDM